MLNIVVEVRSDKIEITDTIRIIPVISRQLLEHTTFLYAKPLYELLIAHVCLLHITTYDQL